MVFLWNVTMVYKFMYLFWRGPRHSHFDVQATESVLEPVAEYVLTGSSMWSSPEIPSWGFNLYIHMYIYIYICGIHMCK